MWPWETRLVEPHRAQKGLSALREEKSLQDFEQSKERSLMHEIKGPLALRLSLREQGEKQGEHLSHWNNPLQDNEVGLPRVELERS